MKTEIFLKSKVFGWAIMEGGKIVATLEIPYFQQYFLKTGNASFKLQGSLFELTFPKRIADLLGQKEPPIKLIKDGKILLEIKRDSGAGALEFDFQWQGNPYLVKKSPEGWLDSKAASPQFEIHTVKGLLPAYELRTFTEGWELPIVVAVFWATQAPIEIL